MVQNDGTVATSYISTKNEIMTQILRIPFKSNIDDLVAFGLNASKDFAGVFNGNNKKGDFNFKALGGRFAGYYIVNGNVIDVVFQKNPSSFP